MLAEAAVTLLTTPAPEMSPVNTWSFVDAWEKTAALPMLIVPAYVAGVELAPSVPVSEIVLEVPEIVVLPT